MGPRIFASAQIQRPNKSFDHLQQPFIQELDLGSAAQLRSLLCIT
jgi:hypothetical protein